MPLRKTVSVQFNFDGVWKTPSGTWSSPSLLPEQPSSVSTLS